MVLGLFNNPYLGLAEKVEKCKKKLPR